MNTKKRSSRRKHSLFSRQRVILLASVLVVIIGTIYTAHHINFGQASPIGPSTTWHYAANHNFDGSGNFLPGTAGFNLMEISSSGNMARVTGNYKAIVWIDRCDGTTSGFINALNPYKSSASKIYAFYLADEPDPTGQYKTACPAANLKAESDWIHANIPGTKSFIVLMNMSSSKNPSFMNTYNPTNSGVDLYGVDPYPCRSELGGNCDYTYITKAVAAAQAAGVPLNAIVPVYQAFGGGGYTTDGGGVYSLPTVDQMRQILTTWGTVVPNPPMDYAYSWGTQNGDQALEGSSVLQQVFAEHNQTSTESSNQDNGTGSGSSGTGTANNTSTKTNPTTSNQAVNSSTKTPVTAASNESQLASSDPSTVSPGQASADLSSQSIANALPKQATNKQRVTWQRISVVLAALVAVVTVVGVAYWRLVLRRPRIL